MADHYRLVTASTIISEIEKGTPRKLRTLREKGLIPHMKVGKRIMFPHDAVFQMIEKQGEQVCQDQIMDQNLSDLKSGTTPITYAGPNMDEANNEARVHGIMTRLRESSLNSYSECDDQLAPVIPVKFR